MPPDGVGDGVTLIHNVLRLHVGESLPDRANEMSRLCSNKITGKNLTNTNSVSSFQRQQLYLHVRIGIELINYIGRI